MAGTIGIWTSALDSQPAAAAREAAAEIEDLGYDTLWVPESTRREVFANGAILLSATRRITVASGIANIYARDAVTMVAGQRTLAEAFDGRFLLGLGVSHRPAVAGVRGHEYGPPVATMRAYLDAMDAAPYGAVQPKEEPRRVLAALGPAMLRLAAERSAGAHPYFVPVEHTELARGILGPDPILAVEQGFVLETDPARAREIARLHTARYVALENYANNLRRLGFGDEDLAGGGSDQLVDAVIAWGTIDDVAERVQRHFDAGATHVCLQALTADPDTLPLKEWRAAAARLL
jgi:probable F420-dependent oxidoreductase